MMNLEHKLKEHLTVCKCDFMKCILKETELKHTTSEYEGCMINSWTLLTEQTIDDKILKVV